MNRPNTPYSSDLGEHDPFEAIHTSIEAIERLTRDWPPNRFERSYAPGKWTARQILTHLAQTELAIGTRARMAIVTPGYAAQAWDQESWIALDAHLPGRAAVDTFAAIAQMNLGFFQALSSAQRAITFVHSEYGTLTIEWVIHQIAGHQIHHLKQLRQVP